MALLLLDYNEECCKKMKPDRRQKIRSVLSENNVRCYKLTIKKASKITLCITVECLLKYMHLSIIQCHVRSLMGHSCFIKGPHVPTLSCFKLSSNPWFSCVLYYTGIFQRNISPRKTPKKKKRISELCLSLAKESLIHRIHVNVVLNSVIL